MFLPVFKTVYSKKKKRHERKKVFAFTFLTHTKISEKNYLTIIIVHLSEYRGSFETLVLTYKWTLWHNPEDQKQILKVLNQVYTVVWNAYDVGSGQRESMRRVLTQNYRTGTVPTVRSDDPQPTQHLGLYWQKIWEIGQKIFMVTEALSRFLEQPDHGHCFQKNGLSLWVRFTQSQPHFF